MVAAGPTRSGWVGLGVAVCVGDGVRVDVSVGSGVDVAVSVGDGVVVGLGVDVSVGVAVGVDVSVAVAVGVRVGVAANILQTLRMPDGTMKVVVEGMGRGIVHTLYQEGDCVEAAVSPIEEVSVDDEETQALMRTAMSQFESYSRLSQRVAPEVVVSLRGWVSPTQP